MTRTFLVVGGGGREHCLAWALARSGGVEHVYVAPGNGGTATEVKCSNVALDPLDFAGLINFARSRQVLLTVVGPEAPLAAGIVDAFAEAGLPIFGPSRAGAQLESSKAWAKELMAEAGVPTAHARSFCDMDAARAYVRTIGAPIVIKADGLAQGKGVTVAMHLDEALEALDALPRFGTAGASVLIEEFMEGEEASVLTFTDGRTLRVLQPAQDHKRIGTGDTGANTGGMGAYTPTPLITGALLDTIERTILIPVVEALARRGIDYRGILYAGLMIRAGTVRVVEFNCRLGDPETQAILPLLATPLEALLEATIHGQLDQIKLDWQPLHAASVVVSAGGYPGSYRTGDVVGGLDAARATGALVFHSGTQRSDQTVVTAGGRVLAVTGLGSTLTLAVERAYRAAEKITFPDAYYRPDIAWRALQEARVE